jgi:Ion channel
LDDSIKMLCQEVMSLQGTQLLLGHKKINSLWKAAREIRESDPEKALQYLTVLAMKAPAFPDAWNKKRAAILRETITLIDTLNGKDYVFFVWFAADCKAKGQFVAAAHNYKKAADAFGRDGIGFLTCDPPLQGDSAEKFSYLREAMSCFQLGGESKLASDCYIEAMQFNMRRSRGKQRIWMWLNWLGWGWGERPLRVVASSAALIVAYAMLYYFSGIKPQEARPIANIINCVYLSIITFATVGYGDVQPASNLSKMLAASEGLFGIFCTGLFLVTFVKRFAR